MHKDLQKIVDLIKDFDDLGQESKTMLLQSLKSVGRELEVVTFKLDRTEKVKRTAEYLLEETITELEEKRRLVEESNEALAKSLQELKDTQSQLIQAEKLASLGSLTAGIAHEIQNPLNFVNNFSEVSSELLDEMLEELENGDAQEVKLIVGDLKQNLSKILEHGRRADSIVKGMLMHSRSSSAEKVATDINNMCDEYLRLSYHGLRAKDKSFNATLHTDFDKGINKLDIIPQDIGRVLLNLINNAFYAVAEKSETLNASESYEPMVSIVTRDLESEVLIEVIDNGLGIPLDIVDKVFQPFFTTKPTGEGTGLGLSLSYDIVKSHGGKLEVSTKLGKGTTFTVKLAKD